MTAKSHKSSAKRASSVKYAYHGTKLSNLPSIANSGLLPFQAHGVSGVFFVEHGADRWGTVLRFPWPSAAVRTGYGMPGQPYFYTPLTVEPDLIEVLIGGQWLPISEFYDADV